MDLRTVSPAPTTHSLKCNADVFPFVSATADATNFLGLGLGLASSIGLRRLFRQGHATSFPRSNHAERTNTFRRCTSLEVALVTFQIKHRVSENSRIPDHHVRSTSSSRGFARAQEIYPRHQALRSAQRDGNVHGSERTRHACCIVP